MVSMFGITKIRMITEMMMPPIRSCVCVCVCVWSVDCQPFERPISCSTTSQGDQKVARVGNRVQNSCHTVGKWHEMHGLTTNMCVNHNCVCARTLHVCEKGE